VDRLTDRLDAAQIALGAERASHEATKTGYAAAQEQAAQAETARLERIASQQKEITDDIVQDYRSRLAANRARYERLRERARTDRAAPGAPAGEPVPGLPAAPGRAAEGPGDRLPAEDDLAWRLTASEQALQLEALIAWAKRQAAIDPNEAKDRK
jgi:hypothetical protein